MRSGNSSRMKWQGWLGCALLVGLCGCGNLWDEVTSRDFRVKNMFKKPDDPITIIYESTDGAKRGKALAALKEPLQNKGSQKDQDAYIEILSKAATQDREPLCRVGAVRALADYKDPRAAKILDDVFLQPLPFNTEISSRIRMQVLAALEKTGSPIARDRLIRVAKQPGTEAETSVSQAMQVNDERLAAVRGLARFRSPETAEILVELLETEKDVALRDRAHQSLRTITGRNLPAEATAWRDYMQKTPNDAYAKEPSIIQKLNPFGN